MNQTQPTQDSRSASSWRVSPFWMLLFLCSGVMTSLTAGEEMTAPELDGASDTSTQFFMTDESVLWHMDSTTAAGEGSHEAYPSRGVGTSHAPGWPPKPHREKPGDRNWSKCPPSRYLQCGHCRAGWPKNIACWAQPSADCHYAGGYIGGGAALFGRGRDVEEGTWGLDYRGLCSPRRVFLNWTCGREQGGRGAYKTDGEYSLR